MENHVHLFNTHASEIAKWDFQILNNAGKISHLSNRVKKMEKEQATIEKDVEYICTQEQELNRILDALQNAVTPIYSSSVSTPVDIQREKGYQRAEEINRDLNAMEAQLIEMIGDLNKKSAIDEDNPVTQIIAILNAHLESLKQIDRSSAQLQAKIEEVKRQHHNLQQRRR